MKQAQVLSERDVKLVLQQIARSSYSSRNRCMFLLALYSGMRVGELAALNVSDVIDAKGKVRDQIMLKPHQTKGRHARTVLLNSLAQAEIERYKRGRDVEAQQPLFKSKVGKRFTPNSLVQVFGRLFDACGLDAASSHSMRRSFLTSLANKGVSIHVLAALAGHRSASTTMIYLSANENVMRAAVELL
jgi:integrase/recombinase XerD